MNKNDVQRIVDYASDGLNVDQICRRLEFGEPVGFGDIKVGETFTLDRDDENVRYIKVPQYKTSEGLLVEALNIDYPNLEDRMLLAAYIENNAGTFFKLEGRLLFEEGVPF